MATSLRNRGLISAVADAFLKAVLELCEHETLQYQWMRYLPSPSDIVHFDSIWKELVREISDRLKSASVLRSRSHRISRITQLRRNCSGGLDKDGNHLFEDIDPEIYLSAHYTNDDLNRLQAYGLKTMTLEHVIERARADLDMGPSRSRLMSFDTSEDWHSRVATLFSKGLSQWGHLIRTLRIIPTRTRVKNKAIFVAAQDQSQPIFHPECNGLAIPQGLGLTVLHSMAAKNPERLGLYMELGVKHATVGFIRKKILNAHLWRQGGSTMLPEDSREQLRFLYLTYHLEEKDEPDPTLKVYTADETFVDPYHEPVYLPDSEPYGVSELLRPTMRGTMPGSGAPGYRVPFINNLYLEDQPEAAGGQRLDWVAWLTVYVGVRRSIRILDRGRLSGACKYVAKYRPEKFLGFLQTCWNSEGANVLNSSMAMSELRDIEVLCDGDRMCKFSDCYFPSEEFRSRAKKYLLEDEFFPFIRIPQDDEPRVSLWTGLLHALRIGHTVTDLSFVLAIMRRLLDANEDAHSVKNPLRVLKLYEHIHATLRDADGRDNKIVR